MSAGTWMCIFHVQVDRSSRIARGYVLLGCQIHMQVTFFYPLSSIPLDRSVTNDTYSTSHYHHLPKPSKTPQTQTPHPINHPASPRNHNHHHQKHHNQTFGHRSTTSNGLNPRQVPTGLYSHQKMSSWTMRGERLSLVSQAGRSKIF